MLFRVMHHNQCFDGACSAAVFTKFHRERFGTASAYEYRGLSHQANGGITAADFGPAENAIVDFKYFPSPKLTWWFDHHQSAFMTDDYRADFEAGQLGDRRDRQFFDPDFISCTGFIASIASTRFGWDTSGLEDLLHWADVIDGARYESPQAAVEMEAPAMKLTMVIENADDPELIPRIIPLLTAMPLAEIVAQPFVAERVAPLLERHLASIDLLRSRARPLEGVILIDLLDRETEALSKFIPYFLFPDATYTIAVTRSKFRTKISVGTNPWTKVPVERLENIAEICERYGGGGHARVGAISFGPNEQDRARIAAQKISAQLRG